MAGLALRFFKEAWYENEICRSRYSRYNFSMLWFDSDTSDHHPQEQLFSIHRAQQRFDTGLRFMRSRHPSITSAISCIYSNLKEHRCPALLIFQMENACTVTRVDGPLRSNSHLPPRPSDALAVVKCFCHSPSPPLTDLSVGYHVPLSFRTSHSQWGLGCSSGI